jgi:hypothetical protein
MAEHTLEQRLTALEALLSATSVEEHFREQAERIDRRFERVELRFDCVARDLAVIKHAVKMILTRPS